MKLDVREFEEKMKKTISLLGDEFASIRHCLDKGGRCPDLNHNPLGSQHSQRH